MIVILIHTAIRSFFFFKNKGFINIKKEICYYTLYNPKTTKRKILLATNKCKKTGHNMLKLLIRRNTGDLDGSKSIRPRKNFEGLSVGVFKSSEISGLTDGF